MMKNISLVSFKREARTQNCNFIFFFAPNFEVAESYWLWPVRPSVCYTCTRSRTVRDRILKFGLCDEYGN